LTEAINVSTPINITGNIASVPLTADAYAFQGIQDLLYGIGAKLIGTNYSQYRITSTSNGNVLDPSNLILQNFPIQRKRYTPEKSLESNMAQGCYYFQLMGDMATVLVGDVFVSTDTVAMYGPGSTMVDWSTYMFNGFCLGSHGVIKVPIAPRIDRQVQIYRPATVPDSNNYNVTTLDGALPIMIVNGITQLGTAGDVSAAALIPAGFMPGKRPKGDIFGTIPDMPDAPQWSIYIIPLPTSTASPTPSPSYSNFSIREHDIIVSQAGDFYRVVDAWWQDSGLAGSFLTARRMGSQPGGNP
jgi:hypothetical protein